MHTEVAYGDSHCNLFNNGTGGVCNGHFSDIPVGGDVCGGRAFWGRFACKGFGRPTWCGPPGTPNQHTSLGVLHELVC